MPAFFAYLHSLSMMALASLLFMQVLDLGQFNDRQELRRFMNFSLGIAIAAVVVLLSGTALVLWSERGAAFFLRNPVFYIKLALFAAMLLIAITPARIIMQWKRDAEVGELPAPALVHFVKRYFIVELILLLIIPLAASLSARGIGLHASPS
jgi:putative membrane protein